MYESKEEATEPNHIVEVDLSELEEELKNIKEMIMTDATNAIARYEEMARDIHTAEKLLAAIHNMMALHMNGEAVSISFLDKGLLDELPKRFKNR